ncbi:MAG: hypothetical protein K9M54_13725 [Kiritimatiellales bacterium]|nr:hypothetical protein [Kiritimatiellales bacterium]
MKPGAFCAHLLIPLCVFALPVICAGTAAAEEPAVDRYGGNLNLVTRATGYFRLEETRGRWWLITPEGHPWVALGVNHLGEMKSADIYARTVLAKRLGRDWSRAFAEVEKQCREWGFNSAGFQAPAELRDTMPYIISTPFMAASFWQEPLAYADVFAPTFAVEAETKALAAAAEMKANPMAIAWTWTDSTSWDIKFTRGTRGTDYVSFMRELPADAPGRQRYTEFLRQRYKRDIAALNGAYGTAFASFDDVVGSALDRDRERIFADDREFLRLIARQYFQTISEPFRREHPAGLLMGDRFHLRDYPDEVLVEAAKVIDVLGIQPGDHFYPPQTRLPRPDETWFDAVEFDRLHRLTGKPIVIADHQCGFFDQQTPKTGGWFQYATVDEAAASYDRFLRDAFARPYLTGYFRCQYLTIYKDHIKRFKQGLVRVDGTPFEDYVRSVADTNHEVARLTYATWFTAAP